MYSKQEIIHYLRNSGFKNIYYSRIDYSGYCTLAQKINNKRMETIKSRNTQWHLMYSIGHLSHKNGNRIINSL